MYSMENVNDHEIDLDIVLINKKKNPGNVLEFNSIFPGEKFFRNTGHTF